MRSVRRRSSAPYHDSRTGQSQQSSHADQRFNKLTSWKIANIVPPGPRGACKEYYAPSSIGSPEGVSTSKKLSGKDTVTSVDVSRQFTSARPEIKKPRRANWRYQAAPLYHCEHTERRWGSCRFACCRGALENPNRWVCAFIPLVLTR